jgi:hypothetical protein
MSVIQAGNTTTTSLIYTGDTTGNLVFTTGGANTVALTLSNTQAATFANNVTVTGTLTTASQGISYSSMPAGSVLQVVSATYGTLTSTSTDTFVDTGLTATITPKFSTSKILIISNQNGIAKTTSSASNSIGFRLLRGSTSLGNFGVFVGYTANTQDNVTGSVSFNYLDSPATTSATTYKIQFNSSLNSGAVNVQNGSVLSGITLMEIAA